MDDSDLNKVPVHTSCSQYVFPSETPTDEPIGVRGDTRETVTRRGIGYTIHLGPSEG